MWPAPRSYISAAAIADPATAQGELNGNLYRAVFTNFGGIVTSDAVTLTVTNAAPQMIQQPTNATAGAGAVAPFTAKANGSAPVTVQWQQKGKGGTTFVNIAGATLPTLSLASVALADSGNQYRAVFTNAKGSVTSAVAT